MNIPGRTAWVPTHPYFFMGVCVHSGRMARKVPSVMGRVCLQHPRHNASYAMILLYNYSFIYGHNYTIFGEHVPTSVADKVIKFRGDSVKLD